MATARNRFALRLSRMERQSELWTKLEQHFAGRLESLRNELEKTQPPEATASLRGKVALLREIQALATGPVGPSADDDSPGDD